MTFESLCLSKIIRRDMVHNAVALILEVIYDTDVMKVEFAPTGRLVRSIFRCLADVDTLETAVIMSYERLAV